MTGFRCSPLVLLAMQLMLAELAGIKSHLKSSPTFGWLCSLGPPRWVESVSQFPACGVTHTDR